MFNLIRKYIFILLLLTIASCDDGVPLDTCLNEKIDQSSNIRELTRVSKVNVNGNGRYGGNSEYGRWINSRVWVKKGQQLSLKTTGKISLNTPYGLIDRSRLSKEDKWKQDKGDFSSSQYENDGKGKSLFIEPNKNYTPFYARKGQNMFVSIEDCKINPNINTVDRSTAWTHQNAWAEKKVITRYWVLEFRWREDNDPIYSFSSQNLHESCDSFCTDDIPFSNKDAKWTKTEEDVCINNILGVCFAKSTVMVGRGGNKHSCWNTKGRHLFLEQSDSSTNLGDIFKNQKEYRKLITEDGDIKFSINPTIDQDSLGILSNKKIQEINNKIKEYNLKLDEIYKKIINNQDTKDENEILIKDDKKIAKLINEDYIKYVDQDCSIYQSKEGDDKNNEELDKCHKAQQEIKQKKEYLQKQIEDIKKENYGFGNQQDSLIYEIRQLNLRLSNNGISNNSTIGGYTVYLRVEPTFIFNGKNLKAVISVNDPNENNNYVDLGIVEGNGSAMASTDGNIWFKVFEEGDDQDKYEDNIGEYSVEIDSVTEAGVLSTIINKIIKFVKNAVFGDVEGKISSGARNIFQSIACGGDGDCTNYKRLIYGIFVLYITFYVVMFLFGMVDISQKDLIIRLLKIGAVLFLISDKSWDFFSHQFFDKVIHSVDFLIGIVVGDSSGKNPFLFVDYVFGPIMFSNSIFMNIIALFSAVTPLIGGIMLIISFIVLYSIYNIYIALFNAFSSYITSIIAVALLVALAPIFIPFILFNITRKYFDNWFKWFFYYTLEAVIVVSIIILIGSMMTGIIGNLMSLGVCKKCVFYMPIPIPGLGTFSMCIPGYLPWGYDNALEGMLTKIISIIPNSILLLLLSYTMKHSCQFGTQIAQHITSVFGAPSTSGQAGFQYLLGGGAGGGGSDPLSKVVSLSGLDNQAFSRRRSDKLLIDKAIAKNIIEEKQARTGSTIVAKNTNKNSKAKNQVNKQKVKKNDSNNGSNKNNKGK